MTLGGLGVGCMEWLSRLGWARRGERGGQGMNGIGNGSAGERGFDCMYVLVRRGATLDVEFG